MQYLNFFAMLPPLVYTHLMTTGTSLSATIEAFRIQAAWCERLGSPFTALLLTKAADDLGADGPLAALVADYPHDPVESGLALRVAGAFHALVLNGKAPGLAAHYPAQTQAPGPDRLWQAASQALIDHPRHFKTYIARPVQTNELRRCACLLGGFLTVACHSALPLRLLEIGASGGLNLLWDRYCYHLGDTAWGEEQSLVHLDAVWEGAPPPLRGEVVISARAGCDLYPINLTDRQDYRRALSYIWPDQPDRLHRFKAAAGMAARANLDLSRSDAGDWLGQKLAVKTPGIMTVIFHSYVWQYLSSVTASAVKRALNAAGALADGQAPLAWLRMEPVDAAAKPELLLTLWPGGETRRLAWCHPHGLKTNWDGVAESSS